LKLICSLYDTKDNQKGVKETNNKVTRKEVRKTYTVRRIRVERTREERKRIRKWEKMKVRICYSAIYCIAWAGIALFVRQWSKAQLGDMQLNNNSTQHNTTPAA
jgi:hypothetical protein